MSHASASLEVIPKNDLNRMLPGYLFLIPVLIQAFLMHPCYEKSFKVKLLRAALMPVSIYLALGRVDMRLFYPLEIFFHWNFAFISFATFHCVCLAIQYGLFQGPIFTSKNELIQGGNYRGETDDDDDERKKEEESNSLETPSFLEKIKFTIWLVSSPRGLQTSWAPPLHVVPRGPKWSTGKFFLHTMGKTLLCHAATTVLWAIGVECAQNPYRTPGFLAQHIPALEFLKKFKDYDYLIPATFGGVAWFAIETLGGLVTLVEVIVYQVGPYVLPKGLCPGKFDTTLYPPLFNDIPSRESLIGFWSKGWHAIFRRDIIFCGWNPAEYLFSVFGKDAGKMAGMLGAMIFSGIFHEYLVAVTSKIDPNLSTIKLFALCGLGMIAEVQFKRRTGRLVEGIPGRIWLMLVIGAYGKAMAESWIERGLGRNDMPLPRYWTWPRYVIPFSGLIPERWISSMTK